MGKVEEIEREGDKDLTEDEKGGGSGNVELTEDERWEGGGQIQITKFIGVSINLLLGK